MRKNRTASPHSLKSSSQSKSTNELSETLSILSNSGIDTASRKLFLTKMTNQLSCRSINEAIKFNPASGAPGTAPTRDEIEAWINTLNQYTNYLSSLLSESDKKYRNSYIEYGANDDFDSSSQISSEVNADEALEVLINRARNSPKSSVYERATQTLLSPNDKFTQTSSPPKQQQRYYEKSTSTSKKFSLSEPPKTYRSLARSQPSHQSRGTEVSPPREPSPQRKSLLAQKIEDNPLFLSYIDQDNDVYEGANNDNTYYRNVSRGVNTSPKEKVFIISPKKREEETQTPNFDENEVEMEYASHSWKRSGSKSKSQNWSKRKD